jgi:hypothetical protein
MAAPKAPRCLSQDPGRSMGSCSAPARPLLPIWVPFSPQSAWLGCVTGRRVVDPFRGYLPHGAEILCDDRESNSLSDADVCGTVAPTASKRIQPCKGMLGQLYTQMNIYYGTVLLVSFDTIRKSARDVATMGRYVTRQAASTV